MGRCPDCGEPLPRSLRHDCPCPREKRYIIEQLGEQLAEKDKKIAELEAVFKHMQETWGCNDCCWSAEETDAFRAAFDNLPAGRWTPIESAEREAKAEAQLAAMREALGKAESGLEAIAGRTHEHAISEQAVRLAEHIDMVLAADPGPLAADAGKGG